MSNYNSPSGSVCSRACGRPTRPGPERGRAKAAMMEMRARRMTRSTWSAGSPSPNNIAAVAISALDPPTPVSPQGCGGALKDKGVPVITLDPGRGPATCDATPALPSSAPTTSLAAGCLAAARKALRPEGGEYVASAGRPRRPELQGSVSEASPRGRVTNSSRTASWVTTTTRTRPARTSAKPSRDHPDLHTLVGVWSSNGPAIADVVTELNRKKDFTVVAFDADPRDNRTQQGDGRGRCHGGAGSLPNGLSERECLMKALAEQGPRAPSRRCCQSLGRRTATSTTPT